MCPVNDVAPNDLMPFCVICSKPDTISSHTIADQMYVLDPTQINVITTRNRKLDPGRPRTCLDLHIAECIVRAGITSRGCCLVNYNTYPDNTGSWCNRKILEYVITCAINIQNCTAIRPIPYQLRSSYLPLRSHS